MTDLLAIGFTQPNELSNLSWRKRFLEFYDKEILWVSRKKEDNIRAIMCLEFRHTGQKRAEHLILFLSETRHHLPIKILGLSFKVLEHPLS